jgi:MFS family permease
MFAVIRSSWALLFGLALLMLGNGLQGTLLGVRASIEGFSTQTTGFVMTGYYLGFLFGSILGPKLEPHQCSPSRLLFVFGSSNSLLAETVSTSSKLPG